MSEEEKESVVVEDPEEWAKFEGISRSLQNDENEDEEVEVVTKKRIPPPENVVATGPGIVTGLSTQTKKPKPKVAKKPAAPVKRGPKVVRGVKPTPRPLPSDDRSMLIEALAALAIPANDRKWKQAETRRALSKTKNAKLVTETFGRLKDYLNLP